jgi:hypothetical protein
MRFSWIVVIRWGAEENGASGEYAKNESGA